MDEKGSAPEAPSAAVRQEADTTENNNPPNESVKDISASGDTADVNIEEASKTNAVKSVNDSEIQNHIDHKENTDPSSTAKDVDHDMSVDEALSAKDDDHDENVGGEASSTAKGVDKDIIVNEASSSAKDVDTQMSPDEASSTTKEDDDGMNISTDDKTDDKKIGKLVIAL